MISSMTGFGAAEGIIGAARLSVEIRSVNHRFFSPSLKLPSAFSRWEGDVREAIKQKISRGHITLTVRIVRDESAEAPVVDEVRFTRYLASLRALKEKHGVSGEVDLATVLRLPDVVATPGEEFNDSAAAPLLALVSRAVDALSAMRRAEGTQLKSFLLERAGSIETSLARIEKRAPVRLREQHERIRRTVADLVGESGADPQRIAQEVAILADKLDVSEEMDRFRAHLVSFRNTLGNSTPEPVGKRLGFILQEMLREANTTGSKANDAAILQDVILIKEELERIREQVENLE